MPQLTDIDVIIRSALAPARKEMILRSIHSVQQQLNVHATPIVVANGDRYAASLMDAFCNRQDIRFAYFPEASTGKAMRVGREMVTAPFFTFLDDDDELFPNSLNRRLDLFREDRFLDLAVSTGYFEKNGEISIHISNIEEDQGDPLFAITKRCWLASCGGLFRSSSVTADYFDDSANHQEYTLLAFKLAAEDLRIHFLNEPTYTIHDTAGSLSKSWEHLEESERIIENMLNYPAPVHVRKSLKKKYCNTLHVLAENYRGQGMQLKAWRYHLRSMVPPHTFQYLAYTRKLIAMSFGGLRYRQSA